MNEQFFVVIEKLDVQSTPPMSLPPIMRNVWAENPTDAAFLGLYLYAGNQGGMFKLVAVFKDANAYFNQNPPLFVWSEKHD